MVIGAEPNGLTAANYLADEAWDVLVLEAQPEPGGAVRSGELTKPGFIHDLFSAFYPLAAASSALGALKLEEHGLEWCHSPLVVAHPVAGGRCPVLSRDIEETVSSLEQFARGDGESWRKMFAFWKKLSPHLADTLMQPFPPVLAGTRIAAKLGFPEILRFTRFASLPVRRMAEEHFSSPAAGLLLAGNALHADLAPEMHGSGFLGWLLMSLGQDVGYPAPRGGAGAITTALVTRLTKAGGRLECSCPVSKVIVKKERAVAVETADGRTIPAARAVVADVGAPALFLDLVGEEHLPAAPLTDLKRFQYDSGTVKVDWALDGAIAWEAKEAGRAGTVHIAESVDHLTMSSAQLAMGLIPYKPYLVVGQMNVADPGRSPEGTHTVWAYTHVPQTVKGDAGGKLTGSWTAAESEEFTARMEAQIESHAPGFRERIIGRFCRTPREFEEADANLVGGALGGGTAQLHQQLVFRPIPGLARASTPIKSLYLASASAHPGGGVHGAPGANAAKAALAASRTGKVIALGAAGVSAAAVLSGVRSSRAAARETSDSGR